MYSKIKIGTCFQENIKQQKEGEIYISPSPPLFEMGGLPELRLDRAGFLLFEHSAQLSA